MKRGLLFAGFRLGGMAGLLLGWSCAAGAVDLGALCADRVAVERVYYQHRLGAKAPFEQALPLATASNLVRQDLQKGAVLKQVYGVEATPAMIEAEVRRMDASTRAPDILAELKAALGNDAGRFARSVAKPIVVERLLRVRFDNDDKLHAGQRRAADKARGQLLDAKKSAPPGVAPALLFSNQAAILKQAAAGRFSELTWQLTPPQKDPHAVPPDELEIKKQFGPGAQVLAPPPGPEAHGRLYFEDLPSDLQQVLQAQLRQAGDVSAVIETPAGFLVYVCREKTAEIMAVAILSFPKRDFEQWLAEQNGETK
jgi:hypothetical protein